MDVDVDNEFDGKFLDQFRSMGTTDRDVLIAEFQAVLGNNKISADSCAFFLDMNNWNLQNAVCSYYDFEQPSTLPSMTLLEESTVGEGEAVAQNSSFVKSWRIQNSGTERWPPGCHMIFCSGDNLATSDRRMMGCLGPGEIAEVTIEMRSPASTGSYLSMWRASTAGGSHFGDVINCHVVVSEGGLLSLTQQLARIGGAPPPTPGLPATLVEMQQQELPQQQQQVISFPGAVTLNQSSNSQPVPTPDADDAEMS